MTKEMYCRFVDTVFITDGEVLCRGSALQGIVRTYFGLGSDICSPARVTKLHPRAGCVSV